MKFSGSPLIRTLQELNLADADPTAATTRPELINLRIEARTTQASRPVYQAIAQFVQELRQVHTASQLDAHTLQRRQREKRLESAANTYEISQRDPDSGMQIPFNHNGPEINALRTAFFNCPTISKERYLMRLAETEGDDSLQACELIGMLLDDGLEHVSTIKNVATDLQRTKQLASSRALAYAFLPHMNLLDKERRKKLQQWIQETRLSANAANPNLGDNPVTLQATLEPLRLNEKLALMNLTQDIIGESGVPPIETDAAFSDRIDALITPVREKFLAQTHPADEESKEAFSHLAIVIKHFIGMLTLPQTSATLDSRETHYKLAIITERWLNAPFKIQRDMLHVMQKSLGNSPAGHIRYELGFRFFFTAAYQHYGTQTTPTSRSILALMSDYPGATMPEPQREQLHIWTANSVYPLIDQARQGLLASQPDNDGVSYQERLMASVKHELVNQDSATIQRLAKAICLPVLAAQVLLDTVPTSGFPRELKDDMVANMLGSEGLLPLLPAVLKSGTLHQALTYLGATGRQKTPALRDSLIDTLRVLEGDDFRAVCRFLRPSAAQPSASLRSSKTSFTNSTSRSTLRELNSEQLSHELSHMATLFSRSSHSAADWNALLNLFSAYLTHPNLPANQGQLFADTHLLKNLYLMPVTLYSAAVKLLKMAGHTTNSLARSGMAEFARLPANFPSHAAQTMLRLLCEDDSSETSGASQPTLDMASTRLSKFGMEKLGDMNYNTQRAVCEYAFAHAEQLINVGHYQPAFVLLTLLMHEEIGTQLHLADTQAFVQTPVSRIFDNVLGLLQRLGLRSEPAPHSTLSLAVYALFNPYVGKLNLTQRQTLRHITIHLMNVAPLEALQNVMNAVTTLYEGQNRELHALLANGIVSGDLPVQLMQALFAVTPGDDIPGIDFLPLLLAHLASQSAHSTDSLSQHGPEKLDRDELLTLFATIKRASQLTPATMLQIASLLLEQRPQQTEQDVLDALHHHLVDAILTADLMRLHPFTEQERKQGRRLRESIQTILSVFSLPEAYQNAVNDSDFIRCTVNDSRLVTADSPATLLLIAAAIRLLDSPILDVALKLKMVARLQSYFVRHNLFQDNRHDNPVISAVLEKFSQDWLHDITSMSFKEAEKLRDFFNYMVKFDLISVTHSLRLHQQISKITESLTQQLTAPHQLDDTQLIILTDIKGMLSKMLLATAQPVSATWEKPLPEVPGGLPVLSDLVLLQNRSQNGSDGQVFMLKDGNGRLLAVKVTSHDELDNIGHEYKAYALTNQIQTRLPEHERIAPLGYGRISIALPGQAARSGFLMEGVPGLAYGTIESEVALQYDRGQLPPGHRLTVTIAGLQTQVLGACLFDSSGQVLEDNKPGNMLVDSRRNTPLLIDFANNVNVGTVRDSPLTTWNFAPPEMLDPTILTQTQFEESGGYDAEDNSIYLNNSQTTIFSIGAIALQSAEYWANDHRSKRYDSIITRNGAQVAPRIGPDEQQQTSALNRALNALMDFSQFDRPAAHKVANEIVRQSGRFDSSLTTKNPLLAHSEPSAVLAALLSDPMHTPAESRALISLIFKNRHDNACSDLLEEEGCYQPLSDHRLHVLSGPEKERAAEMDIQRRQMKSMHPLLQRQMISERNQLRLKKTVTR